MPAFAFLKHLTHSFFFRLSVKYMISLLGSEQVRSCSRQTSWWLSKYGSTASFLVRSRLNPNCIKQNTIIYKLHNVTNIAHNYKLYWSNLVKWCSTSSYSKTIKTAVGYLRTSTLCFTVYSRNNSLQIWLLLAHLNMLIYNTKLMASCGIKIKRSQPQWTFAIKYYA
jgi:hypothetical protein